MFNKFIILGSLLLPTIAYTEDSPIIGTIQPKCSIFTDVQGVYGSPLPSRLSTLSADGGVQPKIRYDVASADYYLAKITIPSSFSSSPTLSDSVSWSGSVEVAEVSDASMSDYETSKVTYDNTTEYDLTVAGTTWFKVTSQADYGYNKSFPAGQYTAIVQAECVAK